MLHFMSEPWAQLLVGGLLEAVIVILTWKWNEKLGTEVAIMALTVLPLAIIVVQNFDNLAFHQSRFLALAQDIQLESEIQPLLSRIAQSNPLALNKAREMVESTVFSLQDLAHGKESFDDQDKYLAALKEEIERAPKGSVVWDFVMPLKPARVRQQGGLAPVSKLLDAIEKSVKGTQRLQYHLVVMMQVGLTDEEKVEALESIADRGLMVYTVDRPESWNGLPIQLRSNFLLIEATSVVCYAERGDDAVIARGVRVRKDPVVLKTWTDMKDDIIKYATPYHKVAARRPQRRAAQSDPAPTAQQHKGEGE